ncbi:hypothetical protein EJB05_12254, partial [Eragrostis curvula]
MDLSSVVGSPPYGKAAEAYKKAVTVAATAAAYTMVAPSMSRELLPDELRAAGRWAVAFVRDRLQPPAKQPRTKTIFISPGAGDEYSLYPGQRNRLYTAARAYLATNIDPHAASRLCLAVRDGDGAGDGDDDGDGDGRRHDGAGAGQILSMVPGDSTAVVFEDVKFTWTLVKQRRGSIDDDDVPGASLMLSFDAEHTDLTLGKYVPFIMATAEEMQRRERPLRIYLNEGTSWGRGISHHHPATFDTLAMDPAQKQAIVADLDRFRKRKGYYRRIGKAWKRGYLLYGPPGTGKSSLVAAMANYLRFDLYDLDLSEVLYNNTLQMLLMAMPNKSILVIEDIDCCLDAMSREDDKDGKTSEQNDDLDSGNPSSYSYEGPRAPMYGGGASMRQMQELAALSTSGEERIIVFTTNYKDRLDPALLRPGRMDMHIHMGYCCWEAFKTLAKNYFLVDDHALFPEVQEMLSGVEVTPAEVSEMLLRSEDADVALQGFVDFLQDKKKGAKV